jgi:hypothetical protein
MAAASAPLAIPNISKSFSFNFFDKLHFIDASLKLLSDYYFRKRIIFSPMLYPFQEHQQFTFHFIIVGFMIVSAKSASNASPAFTSTTLNLYLLTFFSFHISSTP